MLTSCGFFHIFIFIAILCISLNKWFYLYLFYVVSSSLFLQKSLIFMLCELVTVLSWYMGYRLEFRTRIPKQNGKIGFVLRFLLFFVRIFYLFFPFFQFQCGKIKKKSVHKYTHAYLSLNDCFFTVHFEYRIKEWKREREKNCNLQFD